MGSQGDSPNNDEAFIPIVDFSDWYRTKSAEGKFILAREFVLACSTYGFVRIINHSIPTERIDEVLAMSKALFSLPYEAKMQAAHPPGTAVHRGYTEPWRMKEAIDDAGDPEAEQRKRLLGDCKEYFQIGAEEDTVQRNLWYPESTLPGFKALMMEFFWECDGLAQEVMHIIAIGLGLRDPDMLTRVHSGYNNHIRLAHYPPVEVEKLQRNEADRLGAHTDFGSFTLIFQDESGGLQVRDPFRDDDTYIEAAPVKGAVVMNIGDHLKRWSNDVLLSNKHRVGVGPLTDQVEGGKRMARGRYSIPYFVFPHPEAVIAPFTECTSAEHPARYGRMSSRDYMSMCFSKYHDKAVEAAP